MKILILTGSPASYAIRRLKEEATKKKHETTVINPVDLMAYISDTRTGHDRVYGKSDREQDVKRVLAKEFDVIIPRFAGANVFEFGCAVTEHLNGNMKVPSTSWSFGLRIASNKFLSCQAFSQSRVQTMKSVFAYKPHDYKWIVDQLGGFPIIAKTLAGSQGQGVFILNDSLSASTTLGAFSKLGINLLLQQFIDSGSPASDIRAYVVDQKVSAAYRRFAIDEDFRSNYSISKTGEKVTLTDDQKELAVRAARAVGLEGVCAVDLIECNNTRKTYVIEANGNGNLYGIEKVTGHNLAKDIIEYAEKISKKPKTGNVADRTNTSKLQMKTKLPYVYEVLTKNETL